MFKLAVLIIFPHTCELADLVKRVLICDMRDSLANRELVEFVLPGNFFLAAHGFRQTGAAGHFV